MTGEDHSPGKLHLYRKDSTLPTLDSELELYTCKHGQEEYSEADSLLKKQASLLFVQHQKY